MATPRTVQDEMIVRIKSLDRQERELRKRAEQHKQTAIAAANRADEIAAMRALYEVLLRDSLGIVVVIPDFVPDAPTKAVEVKVRNANHNAALGRVEP